MVSAEEDAAALACGVDMRWAERGLESYPPSPPPHDVAPVRYVAFPPALGEPPQLLKGWHKTAVLRPGESEVASLSLGARALSTFDVVSDAWVARSGSYELRASASSTDMRLSAAFDL